MTRSQLYNRISVEQTRIIHSFTTTVSHIFAVIPFNTFTCDVNPCGCACPTDSVLLTYYDPFLSTCINGMQLLLVDGFDGAAFRFTCFLTGDGKGMVAGHPGGRCWACTSDVAAPLTQSVSVLSNSAQGRRNVCNLISFDIVVWCLSKTVLPHACSYVRCPGTLFP